MEKCPYCFEPLQDDDVICRYCGRDVVEYPEEAMSGLIDSIATGRKAIAEYGRDVSRIALLAALLGLSGVGWFTTGIALSRARKARNYLNPGDPGYGNIIVAEVLGWIMTVIYWSAVILITIHYAVIQISMLL